MDKKETLGEERGKSPNPNGVSFVGREPDFAVSCGAFERVGVGERHRHNLRLRA